MEKIVPSLLLFIIFSLAVPVRTLGTIQNATLGSPPDVFPFRTVSTSADENTGSILLFRSQKEGSNFRSWRTEEYTNETRTSNLLIASSLVTEQPPGKKAQPLNGQLHELIRQGDLKGAYELILKGLQEVSRNDPDFFFLNLYAGEFLVQKRNILVKKLIQLLGKNGNNSSLRIFAMKFNEDLPTHEALNKEALKHLLMAWEHIYLVSEKNHQLAVTRLTDAFYALVRPYISYTLFGSNSDRILNTWIPSLDTACSLLRQIPIGKIYLEGHTDGQGPAEDNLILSKRRAESVKDYLASKGIKESLITADGKGETSPIASNETYAGRAKNRRVDITLSIRFSNH